MPRITSLAVALGVGADGALVDVSAFADLEEGVSRSWGRDDAFYDVPPGLFSFTLNNKDGRFTPGNVASPLVTLLTEGLAASAQVGSRIVAGQVRRIEPEFPGDEAGWARVRVSCEDMLGVASRTRLTAVWDALVSTAGALGYWKFDEPVGSVAAADSGPYALPSFRAASVFPYVPTFGATELDWVGDTQAQGGGSASLDSRFETNIPATNFGYAANEAGAYGFWWTPTTPSGDGSTYFQFRVSTQGGNYFSVEAGFSDGDQLGVSVNNSGRGPSSVLPLNVPVYVSLVPTIVGSDLSVALFVDGVLATTRTHAHTGDVTAAGLAPKKIQLSMRSSGAASEFRISRITHTLARVNENLIVDPNTTEAALLSLVDTLTPGLTFNTFPAALSPVTAVRPDFADQSALDLINLIITSEQGHVYPVTTGTLLNPVEALTVRERIRTKTYAYEFDVEDELSGAPDFIRDITNLVSESRVRNGVDERTVVDRALIPRAGNSSESDTVVLGDVADLRSWGLDRIRRGANETMQIASVVVDAMTTPTDRSADLLALVPGDGVRVTGLPNAVLGFTAWDGWFLGAEETHTIDRHEFRLHFAPILPDTGIYGTSLYMAGGDLTLSGSINSSVTSISVATSSLAKLTTTETPFTIQFGREQLTVTAVTGATPQVLTVVRGANGTPASSHTAGAVLEVVPSAVYAF